MRKTFADRLVEERSELSLDALGERRLLPSQFGLLRAQLTLLLPELRLAATELSLLGAKLALLCFNFQQPFLEMLRPLAACGLLRNVGFERRLPFAELSLVFADLPHLLSELALLFSKLTLLFAQLTLPLPQLLQGIEKFVRFRKEAGVTHHPSLVLTTSPQPVSVRFAAASACLVDVQTGNAQSDNGAS